MSAESITALVVSGVAVAPALGSLGVSFYVAMPDRPHFLTRTANGLNPSDRSQFLVLTVHNDGRYREVIEDFGFRLPGNLSFSFDFPVVDKIDNQSGSDILGFAFMYLTGSASSGGQGQVKGEFVKFVTEIPGAAYEGWGGGARSEWLAE